MSPKRLALRTICCLLALLAAGAAHAQYLLTGAGDGGQLAIGRGFPIPLQAPLPPDSGFPPSLLVPPISGVTPVGATVTIMQGVSGTLTVPAGILSRPAPGTPLGLAAFASNPVVFHVSTSLSVRWPAVTAVFSPGGGPGGITTSFTGPGGGTIIYSGGIQAFGGPARFAINSGPGAAGGLIPGQPVTFYFNSAGLTMPPAPGPAELRAIPGVTLLQPGASVASPAVSTSGLTVDPAFVTGSFGPNGTAFLVMPCVSPCPGPMSTLLSSKGYPWTTGMITLSQPYAILPEIFMLTGSDNRVSGVGSISMVSGALALRSREGPVANRGFVRMTLPEPSAALATAAALAFLGIAHGRVRAASGAS